MDFPREIYYKGFVMIYDHEDNHFVYYRCVSYDHIFIFRKSDFVLTLSDAVIISP